MGYVSASGIDEVAAYLQSEPAFDAFDVAVAHIHWSLAGLLRGPGLVPVHHARHNEDLKMTGSQTYF